MAKDKFVAEVTLDRRNTGSSTKCERSGFVTLYPLPPVTLFENSTSVSDGQRILWTAVEKFCNLLMLLNLYFYITLGTLFI